MMVIADDVSSHIMLELNRMRQSASWLIDLPVCKMMRYSAQPATKKLCNT